MAALAACVPMLASCRGPLSLIDPAGPAAREIAGIWWAMFAYAAASLLIVMGLCWFAWRRQPPAGGDAQGARVSRRWLVAGGVLWPLLSVTLLLAVGIPIGHRVQALPLAVAPLKVEVVGRQWAWAVRYPGGGRVLLNELRLPAGRPVDIHVSSADVIHSFWVPRLHGKIDAVPGRVNVIRLQADAPGQHRGQCAEFCGLQHARMVMAVQVMPAEAFARWVQEAKAGTAANKEPHGD